MKSLLPLLMFFISFGAHAEFFTSKIYSIEQNKHGPHLIKFENGRVTFVEAEQKEELRALKEALSSGDVLRIEVSKSYGLMGAQTLETGTGPRSVEIPDLKSPRVSYEPTILPNKATATTIMKRMKPGWQEDSQCYNRAHVWAYEEFNLTQLNSVKLFLFFTSRYIRNYRYKWWFHVSPMVYIKRNGVVRERVLDRRYTSGPHTVKNWTDHFIQSKQSCPMVNKYSDYSQHQEEKDCYLIPVSMYYWQPRDIDKFERTGSEKTSFIKWEVDWAYWEAF